jgi:hypothetical protein
VVNLDELSSGVRPDTAEFSVVMANKAVEGEPALAACEPVPALSANRRQFKATPTFVFTSLRRTHRLSHLVTLPHDASYREER